jgi:hypothetical protein
MGLAIPLFGASAATTEAVATLAVWGAILTIYIGSVRGPGRVGAVVSPSGIGFIEGPGHTGAVRSSGDIEPI